MREVYFIRKNEKAWKSLERALQGTTTLNPDELADCYVQVTDDLSYARTFYPESNVVQYLNGLALKVHQQIYKNKREKKNRFIHFWQNEVPEAILQSHKEIGYALLIFLVSIAIGIFSSYMDPDYVRLILGDYYVNMTLENIKEGDPMAVYKSSSKGSMLFGIASNNIRVSFLAYVVGFLGSIPSALILLYNGVMVGAFQYFFISKGMFWISFSTIFIHGALELSIIVIMGGAGLVIGNSLLFPGTYGRRVSLLRGAKRSLKIVMGSVPVVILAAIIESYITRHYQEMGSFLRATVIILSFAYIIWYYYLYPKQLAKNGKISRVPS